MRAVLETLEAMAASSAGRSEVGFGIIRRVVAIVANARSAPRTEWDRNEAPPGAVAQLLQAAGVPIDRYSFETVEMMKDRQEIFGWRREIQLLRARVAGATEAQAEANAALPKLSLHTIDVTFEDVPDPDERDYFMNLPTTFVLPPEAIDRLREIAGRLLRQSPEYQAMVKEFGGRPR
jgi:NTE family protein